METSLCALCPGQTGRISMMALKGCLQRRLISMGLIEGTKIQCLRVSPSGSPILYRVRGMMLALRRCDAKHIYVAVESCV